MSYQAYPSFPLRFDALGQLQMAGREDHIEDMIRQILFTVPGERVNRPDFGCGLSKLVFDVAAQEIMSVKQPQIYAQLQQWLGHLIHILEIKLAQQENRVHILIRYVILSSQTEQQKVFHP